MVGVFLNLGMGPSDGPKLGSAEPGEVGLVRGDGASQYGRGRRELIKELARGMTYLGVEYKDGIFATTAFESSNFDVQLVLRTWLGSLLLWVWSRRMIALGLSAFRDTRLLLLAWMLLILPLVLLLVLPLLVLLLR